MELRQVAYRSLEWAYLIETGWQTLEHDGSVALMVRDELYHASAFDGSADANALRAEVR